MELAYEAFVEPLAIAVIESQEGLPWDQRDHLLLGLAKHSLKQVEVARRVSLLLKMAYHLVDEFKFEEAQAQRDHAYAFATSEGADNGVWVQSEFVRFDAMLSVEKGFHPLERLAREAPSVDESLESPGG